MHMENRQFDIFLNDLENYARENHIPVVQPDTAELLKVIISIKNPHAILEVGTAIGYSALMMSQLVSESCLIDTIERNDDMVYKARENIKKVGFTEIIKVIPGEAADVLECLAKADKTYDFIFMDAAKGQYPDFFKFCYEMLEPGGVLVSDNVLYQGMVMDDEKLERRKITLVRRLREYLEMLRNHHNLRTTVLPIGDGIAISYKGKR